MEFMKGLVFLLNPLSEFQTINCVNISDKKAIEIARGHVQKIPSSWDLKYFVPFLQVV